MILRWKKGDEYFILRMYQDLLGDWIVSQSSGACSHKYPNYRKTVLQSYDEARTLVRLINKQRKQRGFKCIAKREIQLDFFV